MTTALLGCFAPTVRAIAESKPSPRHESPLQAGKANWPLIKVYRILQ
ncbi:MAG: hypothetical protein F6J93_38300 [Oscillatoria sp. SIO1A7]|nr:hypothetical protein [Oscillatoria sp. SIO1A7]